jgi:predicted Zn-dependent protease
VRAELAALLLQSGRYDDAAREYRALVARDTANTAYRLGLVRALAWGDHPREAEREANPEPGQ